MSTFTHDGVTLAYDDLGSGSPPLLLLHGWAVDRSYLSAQADYFARRHRVVAVDHRGHGSSGRPGRGYSIETFADDAAALCRHCSLRGAVVVGHSMGGSVALSLASRHRDLGIRALILLEALVVAPAEVMAQFAPLIGYLQSGDFHAVLRGFMTQLFGPHFPAKEREALLDRLQGNASSVLVPALESVLAFDSAAAAKQCAMPILYVSSGPWYTDVARFRQLSPALVTAQTVGAGHYFPLEIPSQVNAMIERFIATAPGATA